MAKVSVIVPAAGAGKRFGPKGEKLFKRIGDQPIFIRTMEAFTTRDDVCQVQLVVCPDRLKEIKSRFGPHLGFMGVSVVSGGATRSESVRNALKNIDEQADMVCIHDAARPCISPLWIDAVFKEAARGGAAILAYPIHGTIKKVSPQQVIEDTFQRAGLWEAQTPQVFRRDIILKAYEAGKEATDDAHLVEALGGTVSVVMGDPRNIKITTPADLQLAAAVIKTLPKPKLKSPIHPFEEARW